MITFIVIYVTYALLLSFLLAKNGHNSLVTLPGTTSDKVAKHLLIIGASGGTGIELVKQALEQGFIVTALVRKPEKLNIQHPQLKILKGDVLDYASVGTAVKGQDAVISALGHKRFFYPTHILSKGTANILRAMEMQGVKRFVCETALGIGNSAWRMGLYYTFFTIPVILPFYFWDKTRQEKLIAASELEWIIVRPAVLTNRKERGIWRQGQVIGSLFWTVNIARADVADFMLQQVNDNNNLHAAVGLSW